MNNLNFSNLTKRQKILLGITIGFIVLFLLVILLISSGKTPSIFVGTVPVIPTTTISPSKLVTTLDPVRAINPNQQISFNWNNVSPSFSESMNIYSVKQHVINNLTTSNLINQFGFANVKYIESPNGDIQLGSDLGVLFISPDQKQIAYKSLLELPKHTANISSPDAIKTAISTITNLFGPSFSTTLDTDAEVQYLLYVPQDADELPALATIETANVIVINFIQNVNNYPLVNRSQKGEIVSVAIDTTSKIYGVIVKGGYQEIAFSKKATLISYSDLQKNAPQNAVRISESKDLGSERAFTDAKLINVNVESVEVGYFQIGNNTLTPVFIIKGVMSAKNIPAYPAVYIVPATES